MIEYINETTSHNGKRSAVVYLDKRGMGTSKEDASQVRIIEYDDDDNIVFETWGYIE